MGYNSTKLFGPFSCCFRQHSADSHCKLLHGYGLQFRVVFAADKLDDRNWVVDFGGLKSFKASLESVFDHKLVISVNDPDLPEFERLSKFGIAEVVVLPTVGCEAFAAYVYIMAEQWLMVNSLSHRVSVAAVECWEHETNSAIYTGEDL